MDLRKFISEDQINERNRIRQAEWELIRRPDQPLEAPEEEYDPRTLYERLQANKLAKQEELEESRKLKNFISILDNDEVSFLEQVDRTKISEEITRYQEEKEAIEEFKNAVSHLTQAEQDRKLHEYKQKLTLSVKTVPKKVEKKTLAVAKLVKRKSIDPESVQKRLKVDLQSSEKIKENSESLKTESDAPKLTKMKNSLEDDRKIIDTPKTDPPKPFKGLVIYESDSDEEPVEESLVQVSGEKKSD